MDNQIEFDTYTKFEAVATGTLALPMFYIETSTHYELYAFYESVVFHCVIEKGGADATDFETDHKGDAYEIG